jgi:acylphosphatase
MSKEEITRLHAKIMGRVQGVGFRAFTQRNAIKHDLTGWVRNRWDGSVEVIAEGSRSDLEQFLKALQRGPHAETTQRVKDTWLDGTGEFSAFRIRWSG